MLYFFREDSPFARQDFLTLGELDRAYSDDGIEFIGVSASRDDTLMEIAQLGVDCNISFPLVRDTHGEACNALGIVGVPEIAILDADHRLLYRGSLGQLVQTPERMATISAMEARKLLDALCAGAEIPAGVTRNFRSRLDFPQGPAAGSVPTYWSDISPIISRRCVSCHHADGAAPFPLLDYADVASRADMVAEVTRIGMMPPWHAHPRAGDFLNVNMLSREERHLIQDWALGGVPEGTAPATLKPREFKSVDEWQTAPDLIIEAAEPEILPAAGFISYRYVVLPGSFEQDTYVESIETRFSSPDSVHHALLYYLDGPDEILTFLDGVAPGVTPTRIPDEAAIKIPKGVKLLMQIHYVTTGKEERDTPMVGLRYKRGTVRKLVHYTIVGDDVLSIPPYAENWEVRKTAVLPQDVTLVAMLGHMHLRGKDMTIVAHTPDGHTRELLSIPNYDFNWQLRYHAVPGSVVLPGGTRLELVAHFDNSARNPFNPDPSQRVVHGEQTVDEMCDGHIHYMRNDEELELHIDAATGWVK